MALLFMDGFDAGDMAAKWTIISSATITSSTTTPYGAGRSLELNSSGELVRPITPSAQITVGVAYQPAASGSDMELSFWADNGATEHIRVSRNTASGRLEALRAGTLLATGTTTLSTGTWYYIEVQGTVADSGGTIKVRLNGASTNDIDFTGDTKNGGTNTAMDAVRIKNIGSNINRFDNLYVLNSTGTTNTTFLGAMRIHTLAPSGNGVSSQFTGSDGNQTDNYQLVDELPFSASDYVASSTSGQRDTYALDNLPVGFHQITALQSNVVALKNTAGAVALKPALRSNSTVYYGSSRPLGTNSQTYSDIFEASLATTLAWTSAEINYLEGGMEIS